MESREDENQVLRRVLGSFKAGRRLLVINDEAHHCYLPRAKGRDTELDNSETENERAAVWFSGLRACTRRFQVRVVYDLSATPYYLSGSGFPAYSLFPWVVSDFGLIEAIEAGLIKIPFLPIDDSSQAIDEPVLKNLYENCKAELPRKGQRTQRREVQETSVGEAAPNLPAGRCAAATTLSTRRPASSRPSTRTSSASPSSCSRPARAATPSRPNTPRCARCVSATASKSASPTGYRLQTDSDHLAADFTGTPDYCLDTTRLPVETTLGTAVSADRQTMRLKLDELRDQTVIYKLTRDYLRRIHGDEAQRADLRLFQQVRQIVERWYEEKLKVVGEDNPIYKRLVIYEDPQPVVESINRGIVAHAAERERVLPILNHYNPQGSTRHVFGHTSRNTWPTKKSHVNLVVADTGTWVRIEIDAEAFDRLYGFVSHPIPFRAGRRVAVRVVSQFGEESTKVLQP
ncbi:MAG: hypothetical protein ABTS16_23720 [Candidatus Accumulibacter phosphatis]|uniref:Helicase/UvrB N-terminal domain-containing protein n=1 Tax=Candidatus Accumulibacter contiguus TaxID=2954381 RepID=A0ABX1T9J4_9PROT|nr:hypothetical protein [Candidatus Accumulibacter contiguus]NMQ05235.1 hypothetical protein [Candidatus Accumulibacter contiguus]